MKKRVIIKTQKDIEMCREKILASAEESHIRVCEVAENAESMGFFYRMKFEELGCDPFDTGRNLNLIEQINQTFTYMASLKAAEYLFDHYPTLKSLTLNLGTRSGWDIETDEIGGIVAEVFAAVHPKNNRKLMKDIEKVKVAAAKYRYVFFMCPGIGPGYYRQHAEIPGIEVISLGDELI